jgi:hypothetical protein
MIEDGTAIVLAYVLVSIGVIVAVLWAVCRSRPFHLTSSPR